MRMSQEEKERSHARVVASASRLLRERGLEGTSVADVMGAAGMTHGGFYKHFDSKDALVERALDDAFSAFMEVLGTGEPTHIPATYRARYLSHEHLAQPGQGCPVAALGTDVARGPDALKAVFGTGIRRVIGAIASARKGTAAARRKAALREFSMLVGAMVIARASDAELADEVLIACSGEASEIR
jgi:TetR/AcrR family transcriptional regulator, transcriptional repressor for nem operon